MPMTKLKMSPGTESILRANFAKGFYYNDEEAFLKCVDGLLAFDQNNEIKTMMEKYNQSVSETNGLIGNLNQSKSGDIYLTISQKIEIQEKIRKIKEEMDRMKRIMTTFVMTTMEKEEIMNEEFTMMNLTKLPLTLAGVKRIEEQGEEEEEYEEY